MKTSRRFCITCALITVALLVAGCAENLRNKQLEKVAKDWSLVVRASQVIPVYPLTEDLQPGDVMLVRIPVEEQVRIYKKKGFLPLDQLRVRLNPDLYDIFYGGRYATDGKNGEKKIIPPDQWQRLDADKKHQWGLAPHATFPSYSFKVDTGGGLNLAIPIQGVPFAMNLMHAAKASGSVTFEKAYTYGLDMDFLERRLREWAEANRLILRSYAPSADGKNQHFLRVVSRVYAVGKVDVSINNDSSTAGEAGLGADLPVKLLGIKEGASAKNYTDAINAINTDLSQPLAGGKVKVAAASSRSVTLKEEFDRPLVLGYIGFDLPILANGRLGAPISTLEQLTGQRPPVLPVGWAESGYRSAALAHMYKTLKGIEDPDAKELQKELDAVATGLPDKYPFPIYSRTADGTLANPPAIPEGAPISKSDFFTVTDFLMNTQKTISALEAYLPTATARTEPERASLAKMTAELKQARESLTKTNERLRTQPALVRAIDLVFLGEHY